MDQSCDNSSETGNDDIGNLNPSLSCLSHKELVNAATKLLPTCERDELVQVLAYMLRGRKKDVHPEHSVENEIKVPSLPALGSSPQINTGDANDIQDNNNKDNGTIDTSAKGGNGGRWEHRYTQLLQYKALHGNVDVKHSHPQLGKWVGYQRKVFKENKMPAYRMRKLIQVGFIWSKENQHNQPNEPLHEGETMSPSDRWEQNFSLLLGFKAIHGHVNVPRSNKKNAQTGKYAQYGKLAGWVQHQRKNYNKKKLSKERVERLESVGIQWNILKTGDCSGLSYDEIWEMRFKQLLEYRDVHGNCNVPSKYEENPQLANWVQTLRTRYRQNVLSEERTRRLNEINFPWSAR